MQRPWASRGCTVYVLKYCQLELSECFREFWVCSSCCADHQTPVSSFRTERWRQEKLFCGNCVRRLCGVRQHTKSGKVQQQCFHRHLFQPVWHPFRSKSAAVSASRASSRALCREVQISETSTSPHIYTAGCPPSGALEDFILRYFDRCRTFYCMSRE